MDDYIYSERGVQKIVYTNEIFLHPSLTKNMKE